MSFNLIIFLVIICILFSFYIIYNIFKRKISISYSIMWFGYIILLLLALCLPKLLYKLSSLFGFEKTSNMVFFIGFMVLIFIAFLLSRVISKQKNQITNLTQELAILKKELKDEKNN